MLTEQLVLSFNVKKNVKTSPKEKLNASEKQSILILNLSVPAMVGVYEVFFAFPIVDLLTFMLTSYMLFRDRDTILVKG